MANRQDHIHGWKRRQLIIDLAEGKLGLSALAEKYEKSPQAINSFKLRNAATIAEVAKGALEALDSWIVDKKNRVEEYVADIDRINAALELVDDEDIAKPAVRGETPQVPELLNAKHRALRSVSEELGQMPTRAQLAIEKLQVEYNVRGVNPEDVK